MCVCALLPQVAFVGSILDVVTDVVVHSMGRCAVPSIKHLERQSKNENSEPHLCTVKCFKYIIKINTVCIFLVVKPNKWS